VRRSHLRDALCSWRYAVLDTRIIPGQGAFPSELEPHSTKRLGASRLSARRRPPLVSRHGDDGESCSGAGSARAAILYGISRRTPRRRGGRRWSRIGGRLMLRAFGVQHVRPMGIRTRTPPGPRSSYRQTMHGQAAGARIRGGPPVAAQGTALTLRAVADARRPRRETTCSQPLRVTTQTLVRSTPYSVIDRGVQHPPPARAWTGRRHAPGFLPGSTAPERPLTSGKPVAVQADSWLRACHRGEGYVCELIDGVRLGAERQWMEEHGGFNAADRCKISSQTAGGLGIKQSYTGGLRCSSG